MSEARQAGARGVAAALRHIPDGVAWPQAAVAAAGLAWSLVESLPVSEAIKTQTGPWRAHLEAWRQSLRHLAAAGVDAICYNFMPVLDWTRTALAHRLPDGATGMRFDLIDFAAFDIHILARPGAAEDYPAEIAEAAGARFAAMNDPARAAPASPPTPQSARTGCARIWPRFWKRSRRSRQSRACGFAAIPTTRPGRCWACRASSPPRPIIAG